MTFQLHKYYVPVSIVPSPTFLVVTYPFSFLSTCFRFASTLFRFLSTRFQFHEFSLSQSEAILDINMDLEVVPGNVELLEHVVVDDEE
jgi:hypothetical protein